MTAEQLRVSILQYAIQGKLVEQRTEEKKIDLSCIKLRKTEKIEFNIPDNWQIVHLESVTNIISTKQYQIASTEAKTNGRYPVVSQSKEYIIGYSDDESKLYRIDNPVVIFGDHTTEVKYISFDFIVGADGVKIFAPIKNIIDGKYLKYVLEFYSYRIKKFGGYSRHYKFIKDKSYPLPPYIEQQRIVSQIEEVFAFVDRYALVNKKLEHFHSKFLEQMKKSILQYAMQGKLVEQRTEEGTGDELYHQIQIEKQKFIKEGKIKKRKPLQEITYDEIPFDIPESWRWVRWGELSFSIQYGYTAPAKKYGRIRMVRISDIKNGKVVWETLPFCDIEEEKIKPYLLAKNDILFARSGTVGKSYIVKEISEKAIYAGYLIRTRYSNMLCPEYLYYFMQTQLYWNQLRDGTITTAQPNCNGQKLSKMILPLPPFAEQKRIVEKLEKLLILCDKLK